MLNNKYRITVVQMNFQRIGILFSTHCKYFFTVLLFLSKFFEIIFQEPSSIIVGSSEFSSTEKSNEVFSTKEQDKELRNTYQEDEPLFKEEYKPSVEVNKIESIILNEEKESLKEEFNLFDKLDNTDTYVTYYVYIVKEEDTLDKILTKYNTTKESISIYNDIENIKPGTKLIIPSTYNE